MRLVASPAASRYLRKHVALPSSRIRAAPLSTTAIFHKKDTLPPRPKVPVEDTFKAYLKGSGPGGQKINKTSSAVQLTHLPTGIVVKSQATRSRTQNESIARRILAEKVEVLEKGSESRVEKKRERDSKKKRSAEKKSRRKYRKLGEGKDGEGKDGEGKDGEGEAEGVDDEDSRVAERDALEQQRWEEVKQSLDEQVSDDSTGKNKPQT